MVLTSTLNKMQGRMPGEFIYGIIWSHKYSNLVQQEENQTALLDTKLIFPNFYCLPEKTLSYHYFMIYAKIVETNILSDTSKIKDATADTSNYLRLKTYFFHVHRLRLSDDGRRK